MLAKLAATAATLLGSLQPAPLPNVPDQPLFSTAERQRVLAYWAEPGRYLALAPANVREVGVWQVRMTAEGSLWLWQYNRTRSAVKVPPGQVPPPRTPEEEAWDKWIDARIAFETHRAGLAARAANFQAIGREVPALGTGLPPTNPGPIPEGLVRLAGNPPAFAEAVAPRRHTVRLDDWTREYDDNVPMRPRFAFYRFPQGVRDFGTRVRELPESERRRLFERAGIDASTQRVFAAVSLLEGGFDSINTYDTGYVSVGFIQFAALSEGGHSLAQVLLSQKKNDPRAYEQDFRRFGIDATPNGLLACIDLETGAELHGQPAALEIIADKRLTAVFHRAGSRSDAFRIAQLRVARDLYFPANDTVSIEVAGKTMTAKIGDLFKSEAGLATLMDRKVNTGRLGDLEAILAELVTKHKLTDLKQAARFEREIVSRLKYRKDYLAEPGLTQPARS